jgi:hypothetical protein
LEGKEDKMVVLMTQEFQGISREDAEEASNRLNANENPPAGLIAHVLTDIPGGIRAVDIWESEADFQKFAEERLMPFAKAFTQERGISLEGLGQPTFVEAYDVQVPGR